MISLRGSAKRLLEVALVAGGAGLARGKRGGQLLVLAYHNIVPTGSDLVGDRSLHLQQGEFAEQLDVLCETHHVMALRDALAELQTYGHMDSTRPLVSITFDDAYAGALTAGVHELQARGLPATVFVTPGFLDGKTFWWDNFASEAAGLEAGIRQRALTDGRGVTGEVQALMGNLGVPAQAMPPYARGGSTDELNAALSYENISLAAHTWGHPNLTSCSDAELAYELSEPLAWLEHFGDRVLPMISYPYGLADRRVQAAAKRAGYTAGFMIDGGWSTPTTRDPFAIPRLNIPAGMSRDGFVLRTAGILRG